VGVYLLEEKGKGCTGTCLKKVPINVISCRNRGGREPDGTRQPVNQQSIKKGKNGNIFLKKQEIVPSKPAFWTGKGGEKGGGQGGKGRKRR